LRIARAESDRRQAGQPRSFLSSLDALFLLRRNVKDFVDAADAMREVRGEK